MHDYPFAVSALIAALLIYVWTIMRVGRARSKYGVAAPAITGHPDFERVLRAQQNSVEQMVFFLPVLALVAHVWGDVAAGVYGAIWCAARILYVVTYSRGQSRSLGFILSGGLSAAALVGIIVTFALHHLGVA